MKRKIKNPIIVFIIFTAIIPIILAVGMIYLPLVIKVTGDANEWLGFWGSYLGGIIGTLGVLVVAHLQHKEQKNFKNSNYKLKKQRMIDF